MNARRFIIACPARSGSTMLVHMVRSHPDCVSNSEVMAFTDRDGGFDPSVQAYVETFGDEDDRVRWRRREPVEFMNQVAFHSAGHLWGGFKIKSDELIQPKYSATLDALRADRTIKVLHLNRSNLLERYVSWVMVNEVTGVTMAVRREDVPDFGQVRISPRKAERDFVLAEQRQEMIDQWFADHDVLQLEYEALTFDAVGQSKRICDFLEIESRILTTRTLKISPHVSTLISNFDQLRGHFEGTRFERLFDLPDPLDSPMPAAGPPPVVRDRSSFRIPGRLRAPRREWGVGGVGFGGYAAAVCDVPDLANCRVLAIGDHTDMLEAIAHDEVSVSAYVGLEPSVEYVEFCRANPPGSNVTVVLADPERIGDDTLWLFDASFDVVLITVAPGSAERLQQLLRGVRRAVADGARLIVVCNDAEEDGHLAALAAAGWRADELRTPVRSLGPHLVCTAVPVVPANVHADA